MFSASCVLFRSNQIKVPIDLTTDLSEVTPVIAQKMIKEAGKVNQSFFFAVTTFNLMLIGLGTLVIASVPNKKPENKKLGLILGCACLAMGALFLKIAHHNYRHYQTIQLPKLQAIANRGVSS